MPLSIQSPLADDLLEGASEIGEFLFGSDPAAKEFRLRRIYRLTTQVPPEERLPVFRVGNLLFARKSTLVQWVTEREGRPVQPEPEPPTPPPARRFPKHLPERYRR